MVSCPRICPLLCLKIELAERRNDVLYGLSAKLGHISCHHVIISPSWFTRTGRPSPSRGSSTQSNRVIRHCHYQSHDPSLAGRFVHVEFRHEDRLAALAYRWVRWDGDGDGTWFPLKQRSAGGILCKGFELGGRACEFLAYSTSSLCEYFCLVRFPFP